MTADMLLWAAVCVTFGAVLGVLAVGLLNLRREV